ncbi:MAG: fatty acid desaturase [Caldilineaceae bacterium]|nr:fatty acid desaturase [Caldilineaceae bacterium]
MQATASQGRGTNKSEWVGIVAKYHRPDVRKSVWQVVNTVVPYVVLWVLMALSLQIGYWLTLLLSIPAALFVVRIFVIQHDCGHGSFFRSRSANEWVGKMCSLFTFVPFYYWRRTHALHHAGAGDMDDRGVGDFYTMTVAEYLAATKWGRIKYRLYRNPITMFVVAPVFVFIIGYRFDFLRRKDWKKERRGLLWTNLALLALVLTLSYLIGFKAYLMIQLPITMIATGIGSWFFFVQHNYEDAYWAQHDEWDYTTAALYGSSYYELPKILQWFSGNIGFHHIHHLSPKIPNYLLEKCHMENAIFQTPVTLNVRTGFHSMGLSLWDEENKKMISFRELKEIERAQLVSAQATP